MVYSDKLYNGINILNNIHIYLMILLYYENDNAFLMFLKLNQKYNIFISIKLKHKNTTPLKDINRL